MNGEELVVGINALFSNCFTRGKLSGKNGESWANRYTKTLLADLSYFDVVMKVKCPDCQWSEFQGEEAVGMTPCYSCNSTGYIYEEIKE